MCTGECMYREAAPLGSSRQLTPLLGASGDFSLLYGDMLAHISRYPLRLPMRMMPGGRGGQTMHQDRFIGSGAAVLVGVGLCISSFSLKKLSAMPDRPTRLI